MEQSELIAVLLYKYITKSISEEETRRLVEWIDEREENEAFFIRVTDRDFLREEFIEYARLHEELPFESVKMSLESRARKKSFSFFNSSRSIAAILLISIGVTFTLVLTLPSSKLRREVVQQKVDFAPGRDRAILTLSDGRHVELDSSQKNIPSNTENTSQAKSAEGELVYAKEGWRGDTAEHKIAIPNGGQYRVMLPDGSKVWLNAASEMRFSPGFFQKKRIVTIHGEAYFEVASRQRKPFTVVTQKMSIEVMGTKFNVSSYTDEPSPRATLVEGRIRLRNGKEVVDLLPGEAASIASGGLVEVEKKANVEKTIAWKNGVFNFDKEKMETIMRQISRWYDIEVVFRDEIPGHFVATIDRNVPVSQVLKILELTGGVHFKLTKEKVYVSKQFES